MAFTDNYNPIQWVKDTTEQSWSVTNVPAPSNFVWHNQDVSASTAGRTEDTKMHKERLSKKVKIDLEWQNVTTAQASIILNAFERDEYFKVNYLDPMVGSCTTKTFYVGDREGQCYNARLGLWSKIAFHIIEQ